MRRLREKNIKDQMKRISAIIATGQAIGQANVESPSIELPEREELLDLHQDLDQSLL